jgi:spermidine/putrescine transport system permease protein
MTAILNRMSRVTENWSWLSFAYAAFAIYLLSPLVVVILTSLKDGAFIGFPIEKWTTRWYVEALGDREFLGALSFSLYIAVVSTAIALVVGLWSAVILTRPRLPGRAIIFAMVCMPLVVPAIVAAISLRIFAQELGIRPGGTAIIIAHAAHSVPYIALMALTRLNSMPKHLTEAARDLGADPFVAFVRVTMPYLMPALIGGSIFALLSSFDDFLRSFFLGSYQPTLPVLIYGRIFTGISPGLAAISAMVLFVTVLLGLYAERQVRRLGNR